jgi:photosystem II stability/assembly factor-like uncharacterized protein
MKSCGILAIIAFLLAGIFFSCRKSSGDDGTPVELPGKWTQTNGPCSGLVQSLLVNGGTVFAGGLSLFSTSDRGRNWESTFSAAFPFKTVNALTARGSTILAAGQGIYRSDDNGRTWAESGEGKVYCCLTSVDCEGDIIAMTSYYTGPVWLSTDDGVSWTQTGDQIPDTSLAGIMVLGSDLLVATASKGFFRSADSGKTWIASNQGLSDLHVRTFISSGDVIYCATEAGIFVSYNLGLDWALLGGSFFQNKTVQCISALDDLILAGTADGLYMSADGGTSWSQSFKGLSNPDIRSVAVSQEMILAGGESGVFLSSDRGGSWTAIGLPVTVVTDLLPQSADLFASAWDQQGEVYISSSDGDSWACLTGNLPAKSFTGLAWTGSTLAASTEKGVYITADRGASWALFRNGLPDDTLASIGSDGVNLLAGSYHKGTYVSHDLGLSWIKAGTGLSDAACVLTFLSTKDGIYAGSNGEGVVFSADSGTNWSYRNTGFPTGIIVNCFAQMGGTLFAGTGSGVFRSNDKGMNWSRIGSFYQVIYSLATYGGLLFAATGVNGIQATADGGKSWYPLNTGLPPNTRFFTVTVKGSWLFTGSEGFGVYRHPL